MSVLNIRAQEEQISSLNTASHTQTSGPHTVVVESSEWSRLPKAGQRLEGLSRATLYQMIAAGTVRTRCLKAHKHSIRGIRLVSISSIREIIAGAEGVATNGQTLAAVA